MTIITEFAPAKINLTLEVLGRRADGYHELNSLVAFARDAADVVELDTSKPAGCDVTGPFGATIAGQNLIDVTLAKLAAADPNLQLGHVTLTKNLPVAAGIGGGSADAAAVLRAVRRANPDRANGIDWHAIALSLGADVPVCLANGAAWMSGIGDRVTPLDELPSFAAVLVNPLQAMPVDKTARVFRALNAGPLKPSTAAPVPRAFAAASDVLAYALRGNGLAAAASSVAPVIADVMRAISQSADVRHAAVSGAGPTCFGLFDTLEQATLAAQRLAAEHPTWWVRPTRLD